MYPKMQDLWTEAFKNLSQVVDFDGELIFSIRSSAYALLQGSGWTYVTSAAAKTESLRQLC